MRDGTHWILFAASVVVFGVCAVASYRQTQRPIVGLANTSQSQTVVSAIDDLRTTLRETLMSADNYLVSGDGVYLGTLQRARASVPSKISALRSLMAENQNAQADLTAIAGLLDEPIATAVAQANSGPDGIPKTPAQKIAALQNNRKVRDKLARKLDDITSLEMGTLFSREERLINARATSKIFIASTGLLGILLLSAAFLGLQRQLKKRRMAEVQLRKISDESESHVAQRVSQFQEINRNLIMEAVRREQAEEDVQQQREFLRLVIDTDPNLIFVKGWDGTFMLANRATAEIYGTTVEDLVGKSDADFNKDQEEVEHFRQDDQAVIASRKAKLIVQESVTDARTGEKRWFQTYKVPLVTSGNSVSNLLGVSTDITSRKLAEEELTQTQEQLVQSQKMDAIGRLAGGLAHDFNNILGVILGYGEQALQTLGQEAIERRYVHRMVDAGNRAARLMQQLLAFSRKQVLQPRVINLNDVIKDIEQLLERLTGEDIEIRIKLDPELGAVKADPAQMERVIMNLAVNAREAMPKGGKLTIETANTVLDASYTNRHAPVIPGKYAMLAVSDTGIGMDTETQSKIFDPFFTTKGPEKGTGLGLSTVYGVVKQSGGYIWVYSEAGNGAAFKIYLPIVDAATDVIVEPLVSSQSPSGTETILVVEDDKILREFICEVLAANGYSILSASNGAQALQILEQHDGPIHMLLTDVVMPGMSGRTLTSQSVVAQRGLKVLYMSGYTENAVVHHGVLDPGVHLLQKPFSIGALARKVRELFENQTHEADE
ncbi:MAG TPA: ATP-binding protein [Terriglobales bacterium]|nr:ATP-binding protein [Terriglobales bacterium]